MPFSTHSVTEKNPYGKSYQWPSSLHDEIAQMADCSFIVYAMAYIFEVVRKAKEQGLEFKGLEVDDLGNASKPPNITTSSLRRNYTPNEIKGLIEDNLTLLQEFFPEAFGKTNMEWHKSNLRSLDKLAEIPPDAISDKVGFRPFTFEEFEDHFQKKEIVYSVARDTHHKRITLIFRGTENKMGAFKHNWSINLNASITKVPLPNVLLDKLKKGKNDDDNDDMFGIHSGFHKALFCNTVDENDPESTSKMDQIVEDVKATLKKYPGYKLYVTGHSLGGALSTIAAFYLSLDKEIPKPVTCINFASPRCGDRSFLDACQILERNCQLRIMRVVNEKDLIPVAHWMNYAHVGFQVTLHKNSLFCQERQPKLIYPNLTLGFLSWLMITFHNSVFASLDLVDDHGSYRETLDLEVAKEFLEKYDLVGLYQDEERVGYMLTPLGVKFTTPASSVM